MIHTRFEYWFECDCGTCSEESPHVTEPTMRLARESAITEARKVGWFVCKGYSWCKTHAHFRVSVHRK